MTDLKDRNWKKGILIVPLFVIFLISFITAISTTPSQVLLTTQLPSQGISFQGLTSGNSPLNLNLSSNIQPYVTLNFYNVDYQNTSVTATLSNPVSGLAINGSITYDGGSVPVYIFTGTNSSQTNPTTTTSGGCQIDIFPTTLSNIKIEQGSKTTRTIQVSVPSCYTSPVNLENVALETGQQPIQLGELALGTIQPGNSVSIPIIVDATGVQIGGPYQDVLAFLAYNSTSRIDLPSVNIGVFVTAGVSPVTNTTFSQPPTCALSSPSMIVNNSYSFTCSGVNANVQVEPQYSDYWKGTNVQVSGTSGLVTYTFTPTKPGITNFTAQFTYNGYPIFDAFNQGVSIVTTGANNVGSGLKFIFTPSLDSISTNPKNFLIQIVDNTTGSLVQNPQLFVNALEVNGSQGYTFSYPLQAYTVYQLRGKAPGYNDLIETINVTPNNIPLNITPDSGNSATYFNITSELDGKNVTLTIPGQATTYINSYYGPLPAGNTQIKASADSYPDTFVTINVSSLPTIISSTKFERGVPQNFTISTSGNWTVFYKQNPTSSQTISAQGQGNTVAFTPDQPGYYSINMDGTDVGTFQITGFSFSTLWGPLPAWAWFLIAFFFIITIWIFIARNKNKTSTPADGLFNVGGKT